MSVRWTLVIAATVAVVGWAAAVVAFLYGLVHDEDCASRHCTPAADAISAIGFCVGLAGTFAFVLAPLAAGAMRRRDA